MPMPRLGPVLSRCRRMESAATNTTLVCLQWRTLFPRGTIYDRNGIPLASSNWNEIAQNRDRYSGMGLSLWATATTRGNPLLSAWTRSIPSAWRSADPRQLVGTQ